MEKMWKLNKRRKKNMYNCGQDLCTVDVMPQSAAVTSFLYTINK
jgi:hypothetical protein